MPRPPRRATRLAARCPAARRRRSPAAPALGAERAALRGEQGAVDGLDLRHVRLDAEPLANCQLQVGLGIRESGAQSAPVFQRMRHVAQVCLGGVVHESGEGILGVAAALLDQLRNDHRVLCHRIEDAGVASKPALVGERSGDVSRVELLLLGVERIDPAPRNRLQVGAGGGGCVPRIGHPSDRREARIGPTAHLNAQPARWSLTTPIASIVA
jgi:hypothetical protein